MTYRRWILKLGKKNRFYRKDRRFTETRFCSVCGYPLVTYKSKTDNYTVNRSFYRINSNVGEYNICYNATKCKEYRLKRKVGETVKVYAYNSKNGR